MMGLGCGYLSLVVSISFSFLAVTRGYMNQEYFRGMDLKVGVTRV
jgi:hypothetical protein